MKVYRVAAGLSQQALAARTKNYQARISRIELGATPSPEEAAAIAEALGASVEDIFPEMATVPSI